MPVGTTARSPGARSTSDTAYRSTPASPGCAHSGSGKPGSSRVISTGTPSVFMVALVCLRAGAFAGGRRDWHVIVVAPQVRPRVRDDGGGRYRDDRSRNAGHDTADGQHHDDRERMQ